MLITEALSPFHALTRAGLAVCWTVLAGAGLFYTARRKPERAKFEIPGPLEAAYLLSIAAIAVLVAVTALASAPNSADAMAYHLPRIIYWIQDRSVAFFPTPYLNQIMLQPFAEYAMLHTYLLSGGDRFVNLIQFAGFIGSMAGVSCIAGALGLNRRAQIVSALVCATLPNGILQASGAKNDWLLTLWLAAMVYFILREDALFASTALALALGTKATAYLFAPPLAFAAWLAITGPRRVRMRNLAVAALAVILLNGPQYYRNYRLSGSVLGFDSAQGDGLFRWRNEAFGWKQTLSNLIRNSSEQLGARSETWNAGVYTAVLRLHRVLGIDPQDPATTWRFSQFGPPKNANHEADANNRWHLLLLLVAIAAAVFGAIERRWLRYAIGPAAGFLIFCFYLKWQPFLARLELPLFVLAAPLMARLLAGSQAVVVQILVCVFLVDGSRLPLLENWTRPLRGPASLFREPRDLQYFNDMTQWNNRGLYIDAVDRIAATGCSTVGIDITQNQLEYPFQALLIQRNPSVRFVHVGVRNASARYASAADPQPCAVFQVR